jgi:hypothetical protein
MQWSSDVTYAQDIVLQDAYEASVLKCNLNLEDLNRTEHEMTDKMYAMVKIVDKLRQEIWECNFDENPFQPIQDMMNRMIFSYDEFDGLPEPPTDHDNYILNLPDYGWSGHIKRRYRRIRLETWHDEFPLLIIISRYGATHCHIPLISRITEYSEFIHFQKLK